MNHPPFHRPVRALAVASAVTVTALLLLSAPANAAAPTGGYVALGDSYTSGPLIPTQVDLNCTRSNADYPSLVKAAIGASSLSDVSCGGATTNDMANAGTGELGLAVPAEEAALRANTALVTLGIGGNDIGFSGIIETCAEDSLHNATAPKVATVLQQIHTLSPGAEVLLVGYPDILPTTGTAAGRRCRSASATYRTCEASRSTSMRCSLRSRRPTVRRLSTRTPRRSATTPASRRASDGSRVSFPARRPPRSTPTPTVRKRWRMR
jgi:lysophospholipase L1-like esterase